MNNQHTITFYGVRGSLPTAEPEMIGYGGNTSCVTVQLGDDLLVFDAGTGIRRLGGELIQTPTFGKGKGEMHLFLTHEHWDHIQGLPFFKPLYVPGNLLHIYAESKHAVDPREQQTYPATVQELLSGQMRGPYFPVEFANAAASKAYHHLEPGQVTQFKDGEVEAIRLFHPNDGLGYIIRSDQGSAAFLWDHEPNDPYVETFLREKLQGIDIIVADCAYTDDELFGTNGQFSRKGWGHGTAMTAAKLAKDVGAKRLFTFHHDLWHKDNEVDQMVYTAQDIFPRTYGAQERAQITLRDLNYARKVK